MHNCNSARILELDFLGQEGVGRLAIPFKNIAFTE